MSANAAARIRWELVTLRAELHRAEAEGADTALHVVRIATLERVLGKLTAEGRAA